MSKFIKSNKCSNLSKREFEPRSVAPCVDHSDEFRGFPEKIVSQKLAPQYQCGNLKNTIAIITTLIKQPRQ